MGAQDKGSAACFCKKYSLSRIAVLPLTHKMGMIRNKKVGSTIFFNMTGIANYVNLMSDKLYKYGQCKYNLKNST